MRLYNTSGVTRIRGHKKSLSVARCWVDDRSLCVIILRRQPFVALHGLELARYSWTRPRGDSQTCIQVVGQVADQVASCSRRLPREQVASCDRPAKPYNETSAFYCRPSNTKLATDLWLIQSYVWRLLLLLQQRCSPYAAAQQPLYNACTNNNCAYDSNANYTFWLTVHPQPLPPLDHAHNGTMWISSSSQIHDFRFVEGIFSPDCNWRYMIIHRLAWVTLQLMYCMITVCQRSMSHTSKSLIITIHIDPETRSCRSLYCLPKMGLSCDYTGLSRSVLKSPGF